MQDPRPENIRGEKVQHHVFKHEIQWGYVVIGVAVLAILYVYMQRTGSESHESDESGASSEW